MDQTCAALPELSCIIALHPGGEWGSPKTPFPPSLVSLAPKLTEAFLFNNKHQLVLLEFQFLKKN